MTKPLKMILEGVPGSSGAVIWLVSLKVLVPSPAWSSGLRIQHCWSCGIGCSSGLDFTSGLGTSVYCRDSWKKKNKWYLNTLNIYYKLEIPICVFFWFQVKDFPFRIWISVWSRLSYFWYKLHPYCTIYKVQYQSVYKWGEHLKKV